MKLYYVANARMPNEKAHGIQIAKTAESFVASGIEVELIVPNRRGSRESMASYYCLRQEIKVRYLPVLDFYTAGRIGFALSSFLFACSYLVYLGMKALRGEGFVIYSVDMDTFSSLPLTFLPRPVFSELHGARTPGVVTRMFFKGVRGIIAINDAVADSLRTRFGMPLDRILVEPNGVDLEAFNITKTKEDIRQRLSIATHAQVALYIGRFYKWKGLEILPSVARSLPQHTFLMVGGTALEFTEVTGEKELPSNMDFRGPQPSFDMPLWCAAADALLVLGTKHNEDSYRHTSPMKAFEYMAARRPIVASATPALRSILRDEEAYFYEPDDTADLARATTEAVADDTNIRTTPAYAHVEHHTWHARAARIIRFIEACTP